jgi:hypothetical protein
MSRLVFLFALPSRPCGLRAAAGIPGWEAVFGSLTHRASQHSQLWTSPALAAECTSRASSFDSAGPVRVRDPVSRPTKGVCVCFTASPRTTEEGLEGSCGCCEEYLSSTRPTLPSQNAHIPRSASQSSVDDGNPAHQVVRALCVLPPGGSPGADARLNATPPPPSAQ